MKSIKKIFSRASLSASADQYSTLVKEYGAGIRQTFVKDEYKHILTKWAGLDTQPKKILDVGCGDGFYTNFLQQEYSGGTQVTGVDISKAMIDTARESYKEIDFRVEDMDKMSLADNEVDFVFSRFAVHYSNNLEVTLKEIGRVTKPGGRYFMKELHPFYATFQKSSKDYEKKEMTTFTTQGNTGVKVIHPTFTFEEYSKAFSLGGWSIERIHEYYGQESSGKSVAPMRVPTSLIFILKKE